MGNNKGSREQWAKSWDFLFAVAGASIGLGNIWRFPYLCFNNGGGAFLIPYLIFATLIAIPMLILELSLGQRVGKGIVASWKLVPILRGLSITQCLGTLYNTFYYPIIMVWNMKYLVNSFYPTLPWSTCDNQWNSQHCVTPASRNVTVGANSSSFIGNGTEDEANAPTSATMEYFVKEVLHLSSGIDKPGPIISDLALYLLVSWAIVFLCTFRGIKWMAKVVYVTATLPFILIVVVLVRGVTLDGAADGLKYYLIPDLTKLKDPGVWIAAGSQVFYSFSVGTCTMIIMASFNKRDNDFWRNSFVIAFANLLTSFLSGFAVFSALGYMAKYQNTTVKDVAKSGPGLIFIAYPDTMSLLPLPHFWSVLFFLCILLLGIDSLFANLESLIATLFDNFNILRSHKLITRIAFYLVLILVQLSMITGGGVYVFEIFNNYGRTGWALFLAVTCESVAIGWLYGFDHYWKEIVNMIGDRRGKLWLKIAWKYLTPVACGGFTLYYLCIMKPLKYGDYEYPTWAHVFAHVVSLSSVVFIPGCAIYDVVRYRRKGKPLRQLRRRLLDDDKDEIAHHDDEEDDLSFAENQKLPLEPLSSPA